MNPADLSPYAEDSMNPADPEEPFQDGEDDGGPSTLTPDDAELSSLSQIILPTLGPVEVLFNNFHLLANVKLHLILKPFGTHKTLLVESPKLTQVSEADPEELPRCPTPRSSPNSRP